MYTALTVQEVIDRLMTVDDKSVPCSVWISSKSPIEPIYTGGDRIPIVHVDIITDGTVHNVDVCAESPQTQIRWEDSIYESILSHKATLEETRALLNRRMKMVQEYGNSSNRKHLQLAWLKLALISLDRMASDFKSMKHILKLNYNSPSPEQIVEFIQMYTTEPSIQ